LRQPDTTWLHGENGEHFEDIDHGFRHDEIHEVVQTIKEFCGEDRIDIWDSHKNEPGVKFVQKRHEDVVWLNDKIIIN